MNTERIKITKIKANKANPRIIKDDKFFKLVDSLLVFPKMLDLRPIVVDIDMTVLGGNMRLRALQHIAKMPESDLRNNLARLKRDDMLDYWLAWQDVKDAPTARASELTDDEKRQFVIKDNAAFGAWDYDMLANEWDEPDLSAWGIDLPTEWDCKIEKDNSDGEDLDGAMILKIRLSPDDYAECVKVLGEIDSDPGTALKKLICNR